MCTIPGCDDPIKARGWCNRHYHLWRRNGDPERRINFPRGEGPWKLEPTSGYVRAYRPDHPNAAKVGGILLQHIYVMSEHLGRPLRRGETVHHKNGIRHDNRLENLELWVSKHPAGQRVEDLISFAKEIQADYPQYWQSSTTMERPKV